MPVAGGLVEALRAAAGRSPLDVAFEPGEVNRYPTEVEAAVYFCCLEALQNAGKSFAMMLYPGVRHGVENPRQLRHVYQTMTEFLEKNL